MAINKKGKYIRMSQEIDELLKKLCEKLNDSESNVIRRSIEELSKKLKI